MRQHISKIWWITDVSWFNKLQHNHDDKNKHKHPQAILAIKRKKKMTLDSRSNDAGGQTKQNPKSNRCYICTSAFNKEKSCGLLLASDYWEFYFTALPFQ